MDKREVSGVLEEIAVLLELCGENPFKGRAYENAARAVKTLPTDLESAIMTGTIRQVKGIGTHIADRITELVTTGRLPYLEELRAKFPSGVMEMLRIPGLGPRKVRILLDRLGIGSVGELEYACQENRLLNLPGFGAKSQENILKGIQSLAAYGGRYLAFNVAGEADAIAAALRRVPAKQRLEVAGSLRRRNETVKDIDIVASSADPDPLMDMLASHPLVAEEHLRGETKMSVRLGSGINLDLRVVPDSSFPYALQYFTGSKEHNVALRGRAHEMGLKLNEYGLFREDENIPCRDEADIYGHLDLPYIPPELREDMGEIEAAKKGELPLLVDERDIRGTLHVHTIASDGSADLKEMAEAAKRLGLSYIGIGEHSRSARYARGLEPDRIAEEAEKIDRLNADLAGFTIIKGIECDILPDGTLDYPDEILASFDFVIGSIHSNFKMEEEEMTRRICRALENPYLDILGHPTGRLLLTRDSYAVNMEKVFECAAQNGTAMEFNAHPYRLDLDWRFMRRAQSLGIKIAVCPDAHGIEDLAYTLFSIGVVRKGWMRKDDVLNCLPAEELLAWFSERRGRARK